MKTPSEITLAQIQKAGQQESTSQGTEKFINQVMGELQEARPGWRLQLKSQGEVDRYKRGLLKALVEQNISSQEDINRGLSKVRSEAGEYLPGVGTFITWCKPEIEHWEHARIRKATEEFLSLPKPEIHREVGQDAMAKLWESIGKKTL